MKKECKYCKNEIEFENGKQFGAHLTNCKSNPKKILRDIESKKKLDFELTCRCGQKYKILSTVENLHKGKYKKFCSKSCSNSREHSDDVKLKISQNLKLKYKSKSRKKLEYICLECQNSFFDFESKKENFVQ
jgi:hypothetical protein